MFAIAFLQKKDSVLLNRIRDHSVVGGPGTSCFAITIRASRGGGGASTARNGNASRAHHLDDAIGHQHLEQAVDLVLGAGDFNHQAVGGDVHNTGAKHSDQLHEVGARL